MTITTATQPDKPKKLDKTAALMQIALELKISRTPEGEPMGDIPNWKASQGPITLRSENFKTWLAYRAFKDHGFVASSATLNAVMRTLIGVAMFDEETPIQTPLPAVIKESRVLHVLHHPRTTTVPREEAAFTARLDRTNSVQLPDAS